MTKPFETSAVHLVRNKGLAWAWLAPIAASALGFLAPQAAGVILATMPILAFILFSWARSKNPSPTRKETTIKASASGLRIGDEEIPRSSITTAYMLPNGSDVEMTIGRTLGRASIEIEVPWEENAHGIQLALGLDASQSVARFRARSRAVTKAGSTLLMIVGFNVITLGVVFVMARLGAERWVWPSILVPYLFGYFALLLLPTRIDVGADGLVVSWFWRKRYIALRDVQNVEQYAVANTWSSRRANYTSGVEITLKSGEVIRIAVSTSQRQTRKAAILEERIRESMGVGSRAESGATLSLLRRGDRSIADWITHLRSVGTGANAAHRTSPVDPQELLRTFDNPKSFALDRAAAAVALAASAQAEDREHLRTVAAAVAQPKLRIALEAIAMEREDAEVEAALAEAAEEERAPAEATATP